ncbi:MAG: FAD:protein FMN transferase [Candidatus Omnitrophica bacterium]|nr:FAD:protein FMN transferase [Candidatus Omnitrophota bacterium]MCF7894156.1 FAD:protein FMN transferase [Candidatus Omnitrophota bacterium]
MLKKAIILFFLFFLSCTPSLNKDRFIISGTYLEVQSRDKRAAKLVYQEFSRLDLIFNSYNKKSESYRLNKSKNGVYKLSDELIELIKAAKKYYKLSQGAFDITKAKLYSFWKKWGKDKQNTKLPDSVKVAQLKDVGGLDSVKLNEPDKTIKIKDDRITFDFSGIAKGYMVDKAVLKLKKNGVKNALVNAGGELYCLGKNQGKPWQVGIKGSGSIAKIIEVTDAAVATSGNYEQLYEKSAKSYSHIVDPRTGYPIDKKFLGVTVVADECMKADVLATTFFINGKEFAKGIIKDDPAITAYFVTKTGIEKIN